VWVSAGACVSISHAPSLSLAQIAKSIYGWHCTQMVG